MSNVLNALILVQHLKFNATTKTFLYNPKQYFLHQANSHKKQLK